MPDYPKFLFETFLIGFALVFHIRNRTAADWVKWCQSKWLSFLTALKTFPFLSVWIEGDFEMNAACLIRFPSIPNTPCAWEIFYSTQKKSTNAIPRIFLCPIKTFSSLLLSPWNTDWKRIETYFFNNDVCFQLKSLSLSTGPNYRISAQIDFSLPRA